MTDLTFQRKSGFYGASWQNPRRGLKALLNRRRSARHGTKPCVRFSMAGRNRRASALLRPSARSFNPLLPGHLFERGFPGLTNRRRLAMSDHKSGPESCEEQSSTCDSSRKTNQNPENKKHINIHPAWRDVAGLLAAVDALDGVEGRGAARARHLLVEKARCRMQGAPIFAGFDEKATKKEI